MNQVVCNHCGQPIGVYEPLVAIVEGAVFETSRAVDPDPVGTRGLCFHRGCYEQDERKHELPL